VFEGILSTPIPFHATRGYQPVARSGVTMELGGPWSFYRDFIRAHNLDSLVDLLPPEVSVPTGQDLWVPILIHNVTDQSAEVDLGTTLPASWGMTPESIRYTVRPHDTYTVQARVKTPSVKSPNSGEQAWQNLRWEARSNGVTIGSIDLRVHLASGGLPQ
jgi:hypothetical protein